MDKLMCRLCSFSIQKKTSIALIRRIYDTKYIFTRQASGSGAIQGRDDDDGLNTNTDNDNVSSNFINRNPRNLEYMAIQHKRAGWPLQFPRKDFWHKLHFERSNRHTTAWVEHTTGKIVVSASTTEMAIRKHLYSTTDVAASDNIGRVLAQRLSESGIEAVLFDTVESPIIGEATTSFVKALTEAGIELEEPAELQKESDIGTDYDRIQPGMAISDRNTW